MALKKYKKLYSDKSKSTKKLREVNSQQFVKQEIEDLKAIINSKIKNPQMAQKAAEILKNWGLREK